MNAEQRPASGSDNAGSAPARRRLDWAGWLRHSCRSPLPGTLPPDPGHAESVWTALTHLARREGFTVERANCADADGFTTWRNREIRIHPDTTHAQAVIALAHQLGHILLHSQIANLEPSGTVPCTGIRQVEADSIAYLTATHVGIDTTAITFPHVSSWAGTDPRARPIATIKTVATRILAATATITAHLDASGISSRQPRVSAHTPSPAAPRAQATVQRAVPLVAESEYVRVHNAAVQFFCSQMPASWVPAYLANRGITPAVQDHWRAGHAPADWEALAHHLRTAGFAEMLIEAAGLARRSRRGTLIDTFRDRAILPIRSPEGTIIAFIGRARDNADPGVPKYLNSPATALYDKSEVLFGLWESSDALARGARPVIVEGPLDAIAVTSAGSGKYVGVAPCGTALTASQVTALNHAVDLSIVGVTVAFDPDEAGRAAAVRAYHELVPFTEQMAAMILPANTDPAQILAESGPATLAAMLATRIRPLSDLVINAEAARWSRWLRFPEGQVHALRAAAPLIAAMPPAHVGRQVARLAAIVHLDHATVTEAVTDALTTVVAGQATLARQHPMACQPRKQPSAAIQAAGRDLSSKIASGVPSTAGPHSVPDKPTSTDQPLLPAKRVPH